MLEKRDLKRRHLIYYLRVYQGKSKKPIGYMADLHSRGIMLMSDEPIATEQNYDLRMELPQETSGKTFIEFSAKCLWCKKSVNTDFYESGFNLEEIDEDSISLIDTIIKFFGFRD